MLIIAIGYGAGLGLMSAAWQTVVISALVGVGIGFAYSSLPALIIGAVDPSETGAATGLNTLMRSIGTSVSSAVIGMVLARTSVRMGPALVPSMHGFRLSFLIATGAVAIGLVLAAFLPSQRDAMRLPSRARGDEDGREPAAVAGPGGFRGRIRNAEGAPVARANITLIDRWGRQAGLTTADQDGRYTLAALAEGSFVLVGSATGHEPRAYPVAYSGDGLCVEVDLILTASTPDLRAAMSS
jgi:MFS family permease